jgi:large subunit ribosomal protein L14
MCIRVLGGSNQKYAHFGDVIIAMVKEIISNMLLKKSKVVSTIVVCTCRAIVVCTCKELKRKNGTSVQFNDNVVVVINQEGNLKGTCVFGPVAREL